MVYITELQNLKEHVNNDLEVAHPRSGSWSAWFLVELEFGNVGFWGEGKTGVAWSKRETTNIWRRRRDLNPGQVGGECSHHCATPAPSPPYVVLVVTRIDTLKSGWTPYVYYTTVYSSEIAIFGYKLNKFLRKVGKSEWGTVVQGKELNIGLSTDVQSLGLGTLLKMVSFQ